MVSFKLIREKGDNANSQKDSASSYFVLDSTGEMFDQHLDFADAKTASINLRTSRHDVSADKEEDTTYSYVQLRVFKRVAGVNSSRSRVELVGECMVRLKTNEEKQSTTIFDERNRVQLKLSRTDY